MITRKAGPALAAGCSIVVKPAEMTPLSALALENLGHRAGLPYDLFRAVPAVRSSDAGDLFCTHPAIRKISFTGSTRVGKMIMAKAAGQVKRLSLELGGNAPFIVFDDADLDKAAEGAMASRFRNAGRPVSARTGSWSRRGSTMLSSKGCRHASPRSRLGMVLPIHRAWGR